MVATIGIRREDKSIWERRTPLVPADVACLHRADGLRFVVQRSPIRVYDDASYRQAGAELADDLGAAQTVFAVKEIPPDLLERRKTYVFFSHVIKGQRHNMPLLRRLLELECTLIDYERITDDQQRRLVFFGRQAGQAGMIETLHALGRHLRWAGCETPFTELRQPHAYDDLEAARAALAAVGRRIAAEGLEIPDPPLVVGFAGYGHVSRGAQELFDLLPHEELTPDEVLAGGERLAARDRLFKVVFKKPDMVEPRAEGSGFDADEHKRHPERYRSRFGRFLPHLSVLINAIFWSEGYPRLLTRHQAGELWRTGERKLRVVGDLTCDVEGAIEINHKITQPDQPTYVYHPLEERWTDGPEGEGIVVLAIDNLPCELPRESSEAFSRTLRPFVAAIARADYDRPFAELELPPEIHRAVIAHRGRLTPGFEYLERYLAR